MHRPTRVAAVVVAGLAIALTGCSTTASTPEPTTSAPPPSPTSALDDDCAVASEAVAQARVDVASVLGAAAEVGSTDAPIDDLLPTIGLVQDAAGEVEDAGLADALTSLATAMEGMHGTVSDVIAGRLTVQAAEHVVAVEQDPQLVAAATEAVEAANAALLAAAADIETQSSDFATHASAIEQRCA